MLKWRRKTLVDIVSEVQSSVVAFGYPRTPVIPNASPNLGIHITRTAIDQLPAIIGTGFQAAEGKIVTCAHVAERLTPHHEHGEAKVITIEKSGAFLFVRFYPITQAIKKYVTKDNKVDERVDCGLILLAPKKGPDYVYPVKPAKWGDSDKARTGEEVAICGFPMGEELFIDSENKTVKGFGYTVQRGIISAVLPLDVPSQERELFQLDIQTYGGMSGGPVFLARTGEVIGMVVSGLQTKYDVTNITYALPGNIIKDYATRIGFTAGGIRY